MKEFRYINYSNNRNRVMIEVRGRGYMPWMNVNQSTKQMEEVL